MLILRPERLATDSGPGLHVAPRPLAESATGPDGDHAPAVAVPGTPGELAERLEELLADATDPEAWEAALAGAAHLAGEAALARAVSPLVGTARETYGRGGGGIWYLEPEHDAARLVLALAGRPVSRRAPTWGWADHRRRRVDEVLDVVAAGVPRGLLSTPTETDGAVALDVLAARRSVDLGGAGAGPGDRHQARLRVPGAQAVVGRWHVSAERGRQGTTVTLTEATGPETVIDLRDLADPAGDPSRDRVPGGRSWPGLADPSPLGCQRVPTREADLLRWASPFEADRFDAWAAQRLARNIDWWEADWDERRLLTRLRVTHVPPGLPGRVLLAVGLATKQPSAHQPAVAVARRLLDADLLDPHRFAGTLAALAGVLDPTRLARTLGALRQTHPHAVATMLDGALPTFDRGDRRVAGLVELYAQGCEGPGAPPASDALVAWLGSFPTTGALADAGRRALAAARA
ncbi:MAG: hypothetical protein ACFCVF_02420 [Kineosporiaceae bacterium]